MRGAVCAVCVTVLCLLGAATAAAADEPFWGLIVPSSGGDVHLLNSATMHEFGAVPDVGDPGPVVTNPDGQFIYVGTCHDHAAIATIEADGPVQVDPIDLGPAGTCTTGLAVSPVGNAPSGQPMLYAVVNSGLDSEGSESNALVGIDTQFGVVQWHKHPAPGAGWVPQDVTVSPDGETIYVLEYNEGSDCIHCPPGYYSRVSSYDATQTPPTLEGSVDLNTSPIAHALPVAMVLSPDGTTNYVTSNYCQDEICDHTELWAVETDRPRDGTDHAFDVDLAQVGPLTIAPDGKTVYIAEGGLFADSIAVIDVSGGWGTFSETDISPWAPLQPSVLTAMPDGKRVAVGFGVDLDSDDLVEQFDTTTNEPVSSANVPTPKGIAVIPDQAAIAQLSVTPAWPGLPTAFDASRSAVFCRLAQCGKIRDYTWDFGDGTPIEHTTDPRVAHVYEHPGSYTATMTTTTTAGTSTESVSNGHMLLRNGSPGAQTSQTVLIAQANPTLTGRASNDIQIGGRLHDTAMLTGGNAPTGVAVFRAFGPDDPDCSSAPVFTDTVAVLGNGNVVSGDFTPAAAGRYRWVVDYVSDNDNNADVLLGCNSAGQEAEVSAVQPAMSGRASQHIELGGEIFDTAVLLAGDHPTGSITFRLYGPGDTQCLSTPLSTSVAPVTAIGADALSSPYIPTVTGIYRWTATYSGDGSNDPVATACDAAGQQVQVRLVPPPPPPPPPAPPLTPPSIGRILPDSGPTAGGGIVELFGDSFAAGATVMFGDVPSPSVTVDSYDHLAAIVPPHAAGTVGVFVSTPGGTSELTRRADYTYVDPPPAIAADVTGSSSGPGTPAARICTVPSLSGLTAAVAAKRIRAAGCGVGHRHTRASHGRPGHVLAQSPRAGAIVAQGRKVSFTLSRPPRGKASHG